MATGIPHGLIGFKWLLASKLPAIGGYRWLRASHMDGWGLRGYWRLYWRLLAAIDSYW